MKRGIKERKGRDGGIKEKRYTGKEGFGTGGIKRNRGIKERKDSGLEGFGTGGIKGKEG